MFISIADFYMQEIDDSYILITLIDAMGQPEETKRFNKQTDYEKYGKWIQVGYLSLGDIEKYVYCNQGFNAPKVRLQK